MLPLPEEFQKRMSSMLGEELDAFLASYEEDRSRGLRFNPLKLEEEKREDSRSLSRLLEEFPAMREWNLSPIPWSKGLGFFYRDPARPGKSPLHEAGLFYLQEPSAMSVAAIAGIRPGERVLDLCAAPGGKSTMAASFLQGKGLLVSNEINPGRARILSQNVERMGISNAIVTNEPPERLAERFPSFFDRVIVDAPCSGEGMFRKEEQALAMWSEENVRTCAGRQAGILDEAAVMLKSGGRLVYSTCTFAPEEDEQSIAAFLDRHPEFAMVDLPGELGEQREAFGFDTGHPEWCGGNRELTKAIRLWPHRLEGEGHFVAVLQKEGEISMDPLPEAGGFAALLQEDRKSLTRGKAKKKAGKWAEKAVDQHGQPKKGGKNSSNPSSGGKKELLEEFLRGTLQEGVWEKMTEESCGGVRSFGDDLYLMPFEAVIETAGLRILRAGLQLGTVKKDRLEPSHALALALHRDEVRRTMNLSSEEGQAAAWLRGESLSCDPSWKGWVLVLADGVSLGWGKASGGMLKNHYPKGLRRPF